MKLMRFLPMAAGLLLGLSLSAQQPLTPHTVQLAEGRSVTLNMPENFALDVAIEGLQRVRFMTKSPDGRVFVTDMFSLSDNSRGAVYILDGWDGAKHAFAKKITYLDHLRNPNNVAFYTDSSGQMWLYMATTERLVRYRYAAGDTAPTGEPEVLATYPDYGLNYRFGGWHLTRTVAFASLHGKKKLYVSVGSSCNACKEKEEVRATISEMDPDGSHARIIARGLRNAVWLNYVPGVDGGALLATNMGSDHLGDTAPEDTFFEVDSVKHPREGETNYGWPTCYFASGKVSADPRISDPKPEDHTVPAPPAGPAPEQFDCAKVPAPFLTFPAHSSPLGFAWFTQQSPVLKNSFLIALHGASKISIGTGYRVVRYTPGSPRAEEFITGFLTTANGHPFVAGRPCGLLVTGPDSFLLTDDRSGVIYAVHPR
ncbi:MAG TPA: hypothetical protein VGC07_02130 [Granulicella sp.]